MADEPKYYRVREGRVYETVEFADSSVLADLDRKGRLLGVEVLTRDPRSWFMAKVNDPADFDYTPEK